MEYKKGVRFKHPSAPEWGVGEVLEDSPGDVVRFVFVGAGEKKLSLKDLQLEKVDGDESKHPILDNLKLSAVDVRYRSLPESIRRFLIEYPGGFYGEKVRPTRTRLQDQYSSFDDRIAEQPGSLQALGKRSIRRAIPPCLKVMSSTNLIFPNEQMAAVTVCNRWA